MRFLLMDSVLGTSQGNQKSVANRRLPDATTAELPCSALTACASAPETGAVAMTTSSDVQDTLSRMQDTDYARSSSYKQPLQDWFETVDLAWKGASDGITESIFLKVGGVMGLRRCGLKPKNSWTSGRPLERDPNWNVQHTRAFRASPNLCTSWVVFLNGGRIIKDDKPERLLDHPCQPEAAAFIHSKQKENNNALLY